MPTGVLRPNVAVDRKLRWLNVELVGDIFADLNLLMTTAVTRAGLKIMAVLNDGKMRRQWLPPCTISDVALLTFARL
jgi:hypothetical protein